MVDLAQPKTEVGEWRRGRNYIRVGDRVKIAPSAPGRRDGFVATVRRLFAGPDGRVSEVEVIGGPAGRPRAFRSVRPERVARMAQTRGGEPVGTGPDAPGRRNGTGPT